MKSSGYIFMIMAVLFSCWYLDLPLHAATQDKGNKSASDLFNSGTFAGLTLRAIGPALTSGRISDIAVVPNSTSTYYIAAASGGIWKTTNNGTTWTPIFDNEGSYSIGCITIDAKNPSVIWVGSGENNSQRSVSYGDGVYRSDDGGKSWQNLGLKNSEHIGEILIDPRNSNTVFVAAQGPLWSAGGDRGLYKTTNNGKTWKKVLEISENTGVTDITINPANPDIMLAAAHQRRRHVWTMIDGGPESALYRSTDGGETWNKITSGLPVGEVGRIGIAVAPSQPNVAYAHIEAASGSGGLFRSTDFGASWEKRNGYFASPMMYYGPLYVDPKNADRVYIMGTFIMASEDGCKTVNRISEKSKHVDSHVMWIDPKNSDHLMVGCDGGLYESYDRAAYWNYKSNLSITQFYDIAVDNSKPFYNIYGGTQDNFSLGGPSRTNSVSGITNADWFVTNGGDGFRSQVDPEDPNTIYSESQYGGLVRFDRRTGESKGIQPQTGKDEDGLRWNWDSPILISPHSHTRIYFSANKLFRSDDRGDTWRAISGDLTRQIDRNKLPVMGKVWGPDAIFKHGSTSLYGNATALAESPKKEGLIYWGSDDGLIQVTENGGQQWRKLEKFPGVPEMTYVSRLLASQHDTNTVYAAFENHKNGDFAPYLLKSTDAGKTWISIKGDLPNNGPVLAIAEDHVDPNLLFVGTEFGLFFSSNGGQKWVKLTGNMPIISVRDLAIQKRENDLIVATFGRGLYVLDDYTPLRLTKPETLTEENHIYPVKDVPLYIPSRPLGATGRSFQGENYFIADNPPYGATITYYLKETLKTKKKLRQEAEKEAERKHTELYYPTPSELRAEAEEPAPEVIITISDANGNVIRTLNGSTAAGVHRITWNLRYPETSLNAGPRDDDDEGFEPGGTLVLPGKYKVSMAKRYNGVLTPLSGSQEFNLYVEGTANLNEADRKALFDFQQKVASLERALNGTLEAANTARTKLAALKKAIKETPTADNRFTNDALAMEKQLNQILIALRGDVVMRSRSENTPTSIVERVNTIISNQIYSSAKPTQTDLDGYKLAAQLFATELARLRTLIEVDIKNLEKALEDAGAPPTPGRLPDWKDR